MASKKAAQRQFNILVKTHGMTKAIAMMKELNQVTDASATSQNKAKRAQDGVSRATVNTTKSFAKQAQGLGGLVRFYATWAANLFAVTAAFGALKRASDLNILIQQTETLGIKSGLAFESIARGLKDVSAGALSMREALQSASIALNSGLEPDQLLKLADGATKLAQTLGRDVAESINRVTLGVIKGEAELLDELGIVLRLDRAYSDYAKTLGKTTKELSINQKQQALAVSVLEQMAEKTADFEAIENPFDRFAASLLDVANIMTGIVSGPLGALASFLADNLTALIPVVILAISKLGNTFVKTGAEANASIDKTTANFDEYATTVVAKSGLINKALGSVAIAFRSLTAATSTGFSAGQAGLIGDDVTRLAGDLADLSKGGAAGEVGKFSKLVTGLGAAFGYATSFALRFITTLSIYTLVFTAVGAVLSTILTKFGIFNEHGQTALDLMKESTSSQLLLNKAYEDYQENLEDTDRTLSSITDDANQFSNILETQVSNIDKASDALDEFAKADAWDKLAERFKEIFGGGIINSARDQLKEAVQKTLALGLQLSLPRSNGVSKLSPFDYLAQQEEASGDFRSGFGLPGSSTSESRVPASTPGTINIAIANVPDDQVNAELQKFSFILGVVADRQSEYSGALKNTIDLLEKGGDVTKDLIDNTIKTSIFKTGAETLRALTNEVRVMGDSFDNSPLGSTERDQILRDFKDMAKKIDPRLANRYGIELNKGMKVFIDSVSKAADKYADILARSITINRDLETSKLKIVSLNEKIRDGEIDQIRALAAEERRLLDFEIDKNKLQLVNVAATLKEKNLSKEETVALKAQVDVIVQQNKLYKQQIDRNSDARAILKENLATLDRMSDSLSEIKDKYSDISSLNETIIGSAATSRQEKAIANFAQLGVSQELHYNKLAELSILIAEETNRRKDREALGLETSKEQLTISKLENQQQIEIVKNLIKQEELRRSAIDSIIASNDFSTTNFKDQFGASLTREQQNFSDAMDSHVQNVQKVVLTTFDAGIDDFTNALVNDGKFNIDAMKDALRNTLAEITSDYLKQAMRQLMSNIFDPQQASTMALIESNWAIVASNQAMAAAATAQSASASTSLFGTLGTLGSALSGPGSATNSGASPSTFFGTTDTNGINAMFLPGNAKGGVIDKPMVSWIAEGGQSEAIVPLPDNKSIPVIMEGGGETINITQSFDFRNADKNAVAQLRAEANKIQRATINAIYKDINRGGQGARITGRR